MADPLLTAQDLIDRYDGGEEALRRFAGTKVVGNVTTYDDGKVDKAIATTSEEGYEILLSGYETNERVQALAANDARVIDALAIICRYHLTKYKDDFREPDGQSIFKADTREARDVLREKARGAKRSSSEQVNPNGPGQSGLLRPRSAHRIPSVLLDSNGRPVGF